MKRKSLRQTIALVIIAAILSLSGNFVYADDNFKASSDRALLYDLKEELTAIQSSARNIELNIENSVIFDGSSDSAALFTSSTSGTCGDGLTWNFDDETQTLTISGNGTMDDYVYTSDIPWYDIRESIVNLLIEDGVTSIGSGAFYNCTSLTDINLSDTVIQIGSMAFFNCTSIISLNMPNSVKTLGTYVFCNCSNMKSCGLSSLLETISEGTFYYCSALSEVSGAENIDVIGTGAFYYCTSLVEYSLPEYVSVIEYAAFCGCTLLETVKINNVLKTIDDGVFINAKN